PVRSPGRPGRGGFRALRSEARSGPRPPRRSRRDPSAPRRSPPIVREVQDTDPVFGIRGLSSNASRTPSYSLYGKKKNGPDPYSVRSALIGEIAAARPAGM